MNRSGQILLGYIILVLLLVSCGDSSEEVVTPDNERPICEIITPLESSVINYGDSLTITVRAYDNDGYIDHIRFYLNDLAVDTIEAETYPVGTELYSLKVYTRDYPLGELVIRVNPRDNEGKENVDQNIVQLYSEFIMNITEPNGGEYLAKGESKIITWNSDLNENVKIDLYKDGMYLYEIIGSTPNDGEYSWAIPTDLQSSDDYSIKISGIDHQNIFDLCDNEFSLLYVPSFTFILLLSPNGSEGWSINTSEQIKWNSNFTDDVAIDLYKGGNFYTSIGTQIENTGIYFWTVPDTIPNANDYKIKIKRSSDTDFMFDYSDDIFSINF